MADQNYNEDYFGLFFSGCAVFSILQQSFIKHLRFSVQ